MASKARIFQLIQGPLVAVIVGIIYYELTVNNAYWSIAENNLVKVPIPEDMSSFLGQFTFPNFSMIVDAEIWITAFTIALVASLETLLCVEATDKLDPYKRVTPTNRELLAQGVGNICSGLIGGLPVTQVIVRVRPTSSLADDPNSPQSFMGYFYWYRWYLFPSCSTKSLFLYWQPSFLLWDTNWRIQPHLRR